MKTLLTRFAIVLGLLFLQMPYAYSQDKPKERQQKEANNDDMDEGEAPPEEGGEPAKKYVAHGPRIGLGLEAGAGASALRLGGSMSDVNIAATIGAYADIRMAGRFYIQPGLYYTLNGGSNVSFNRVIFYDRGVIINMIEAPVTVAFKTGRPGAKVRFTAGLGGYVGYNVGAAINSVDLMIGEESTDDLKPLDIGLAMNIGLELRNGLFFRMKAQAGLTDLQTYATGPSIYTQTNLLTIGYLINNHTRHYHRTPKVKQDESGKSRRM